MEPQILMEELLIEILLRLPVKSLARFKCVSKSWLSLISDPHFVQSHFDLDHARNQRLLLSVDGALEIASIDFNLSLLHDDSTSAVLIPQRSRLIGFCREFTGSQIIGSCRGFTLFHYFPNFCIWKPCTGYIRKLPSSPIYSYANRPISTFLHGFGYDPLTDDYLVTIACREGSRGNEKTHVEIFSLRADAWEQFEGNQLEALNAPATFFSKVGLFFNDAIHWIACGYQRSVDVIVAFDLTKRVFTEIALPDNFHCVVEFCELRILGGFLSVCIAGCKDIDGEILVMKEYKVQSSWTKSHIVLSARNISTRYLYPICLTVGGDIVGIDGYTELVKFTDKGEVLERRDYYDAEEYAHQRECAFYHRVKKCGVVMHTESLFSLPCYN